jgi:hypothetical protein
MSLTGGLLFASDPVGFSANTCSCESSWGIMLLAGLNVWLYHVTVYRRVADWD